MKQSLVSTPTVMKKVRRTEASLDDTDSRVGVRRPKAEKSLYGFGPSVTGAEKSLYGLR